MRHVVRWAKIFNLPSPVPWLALSSNYHIVIYVIGAIETRPSGSWARLDAPRVHLANKSLIRNEPFFHFIHAFFLAFLQSQIHFKVVLSSAKKKCAACQKYFLNNLCPACLTVFLSFSVFSISFFVCIFFSHFSPLTFISKPIMVLKKEANTT